jgi:hypothetical protein
MVEPAAVLVLELALVLLLQPATVAASAAAIANMAMGEGRGTILTLPVFGFFGSLLAPVDLEFVDGIAVLEPRSAASQSGCGNPAPLQRSPMEPRFRPYFKPSSKLRMRS